MIPFSYKTLPHDPLLQQILDDSRLARVRFTDGMVSEASFYPLPAEMNDPFGVLEALRDDDDEDDEYFE